MSEMSFEEDWNSGLKDYARGAFFSLPSAVQDPFNNLLFERSLNTGELVGDLPFIGPINSVFNPFEEDTTGESRLGLFGFDDALRMRRDIERGDYAGAVVPFATSAAEVATAIPAIAGVAKAGKAGAGVLSRLFGGGARAADDAPKPTLPGVEAPKTKTPATPAASSNILQRAAGRIGNTWSNAGLLGKAGMVAVPSVGVFGSLLGAFLDDTGENTTQAFQPTTLPNSIPTGPVDNTQNILDIIREGQARQEANLRQQRADALAGFGTEERQAFADWANMLDRARRGQTSAIRGDYQALYDRLAGDVGAIEGMGAAGGAAVNKRYRQAARRARREGRRENVRSGLGGLTPVSGRMADMPANLRGQGGDLAQYVRNNAAVAARDAGFNAEASLEYGNAVANEFNQNLALMRAQQEFNLETQLAREQRALGSEYDNMLADLARQGIDAETQIAIERAQNEAAAGAVRGVDLLANPLSRPRLEQEWEVISAIINGNIPEGISQSRIDSAYRVADELYGRYGEMTLEAYANMFADTPGGPASLGVE